LKDYPNWTSIVEHLEKNIVEYGPLGLGTVRYENILIPLIIFPLPKRDIYPIDENTKSVVIFDFVNVFPIPLPIFFAMIIVFNDLEDPLWTIKTLPVSKLYLDNRVSTNAQAWKYLKKIDSNIPLRFCNERGISGLIILDSHGRILNKTIVQNQTQHFVLGEEAKRIKEIKNAILFLKAHQAKHKFTLFREASTNLHSIVCTFLTAPSGHGITIPRNRNLFKSRQDIFSLVLDHERLVRREHVIERNEGDFGVLVHDIFISYAHADYKHAFELCDYIISLWPSLKIFITDPNNLGHFEQDPMYFIRASRKSKTIVYLATPNSIERPMSHTEIGLNADKDIFCLLFGWPDRVKFDSWLSKNIYIFVPPTNIFMGLNSGDLKQFVRGIAKSLNLVLPEVIPTSPFSNLKIRKSNVSSDPRSKYFEDFEKIKDSVTNTQTEAEAEKLMDNFFISHRFESEASKDHVMASGPYFKLWYILSALTKADQRIIILDLFPALINEKFLRFLAAINEDKNLKTSWIQPVMKAILSKIHKNS
jgi:hypothetical protein